MLSGDLFGPAHALTPIDSDCMHNDVGTLTVKADWWPHPADCT